MKFFHLGALLGAISSALIGCSSNQHQLGEASGAAGGAAGNGNSGGESALAGASNLAGAIGLGGSSDGGSSGTGNAAGDSAVGGAVALGGASSAGSSGSGSGGLEASCTQSGGTVTTAMCCASVGDFPNQCAIGACGCSLSNSHEIKVCSCPGTGSNCFDGLTCGHTRGGSGSGGASGNGG